MGRMESNEWTIQGDNVNLVVIEPAAKPSHCPRAILRSPPDIRRPSRQADPARLYKPHHHPRQGLEVALVQPLSMLAEDMNERIIQMRCVLHGSPLKECFPRKILTLRGTEMNTSHFCQSIRWITC